MEMKESHSAHKRCPFVQQKPIRKVRKGEDVSLRYYALLEVGFDFQSDAFSFPLQSHEPLLVHVCPPVRQVGPLSPVVSRAAVSVPAYVPERQVGLVSRHRPHVLVRRASFSCVVSVSGLILLA